MHEKYDHPAQGLQHLTNRLRLAGECAWNAARPALRQARQDLLQYSYCAGESLIHRGFLSVAVPMRAPDYEEPLAFNCAMPASQLENGQIERDIGPRLLAMVRSIEAQLGYGRP